MSFKTGNSTDDEYQPAYRPLNLKLLRHGMAIMILEQPFFDGGGAGHRVGHRLRGRFHFHRGSEHLAVFLFQRRRHRAEETGRYGGAEAKLQGQRPKQ